MRLSLKRQLSRSASFLALASVLSVAVAQEGPLITCATYVINEEVTTTNGNIASVAVGDTFTFTMTPGTATSAAWRIVNDASGSPASTLTPGGTVSSTLTYTVTVASAGAPVGYFVDALNGTANITASSRSRAAVSATPVPTMSEWGLLLMGMALAVATAFSLRRRQG